MKTHKRAELDRMAENKNWRGFIHKRTRDWHACMGTYSDFGCDGCDQFNFCMVDYYQHGQRPKYLEDVIVILEETE